MKHSKLKPLILIVFSLFSFQGFCFDGEHFFSVQLVKEDRFDDKGKRLNNIRDILKQDRINFHERNIRQVDDEDDTYYDKKKHSNKDLFERYSHAKIEISNTLKKKITSTDDVTICVIILTPKHIAIHKDKCPNV